MIMSCHFAAAYFLKLSDYSKTGSIPQLWKNVTDGAEMSFSEVAISKQITTDLHSAIGSVPKYPELGG
jgi:hypothetical protein